MYRLPHQSVLVQIEYDNRHDSYRPLKCSMPGQKCCVCGSTQALDDKASFYHFPREIDRRTLWKDIFGIQEKEIKPCSRVCSRHFPDGDSKKAPSLNLGTYQLTQEDARILFIREKAYTSAHTVSRVYSTYYVTTSMSMHVCIL